VTLGGALHWMTAHWPWVLGAACGVALLAVACRQRVASLMRLMKALTTDKRLPRPVRWLFRVAFIVKCIPGPDFGIDEALLLIGALLLAGPYRHVWRAIRQDLQPGSPRG